MNEINNFGYSVFKSDFVFNLQALKDAGKLLITRDMVFLAFTFFFTGLQLNIWSAVYNTCIGFTTNFGDERKGLAVISGIFIGIIQ